MSKLAISTTEQENATIFLLDGSADLIETGLLDKHLQEVFAQGKYMLVIDLSELDFMSSLGLGSLIRAHTRCRDNQGQLSLVNPQPRILRIFKTTRLTELFEMYPSVEDAVQSMQKICRTAGEDNDE
jgi:anti-sigma B factor antagonist